MFIPPWPSYKPDTISLEQSLSWQFNTSDNTEKYLGFHPKCPKVLPNFNQIWTFSTDFHTSPHYQISQKSVQWIAALIHTDRLPDGRMDMTKLSPKRDTSLTKISFVLRPKTQNGDCFMHQKSIKQENSGGHKTVYAL